LILDPHSLIVGPAMGYYATHPIKHIVGRARFAMVFSANKSGDTAHSKSSSGRLSVNELHA
jgi:hypothetical protein